MDFSFLRKYKNKRGKKFKSFLQPLKAQPKAEATILSIISPQDKPNLFFFLCLSLVHDSNLSLGFPKRERERERSSKNGDGHGSSKTFFFSWQTHSSSYQINFMLHGNFPKISPLYHISSSWNRIFRRLGFWFLLLVSYSHLCLVKLWMTRRDLVSL